MLSKRIISVLTYNEGILFRTKLFNPDYRYTANFVDTWSIDEIIILDVTREQNKSRKSFYEAVESYAEKCFVPITVGGWVDNLEEVKRLMNIGADKVSINTQALLNPDFITEVSSEYGNQAVIISIDALKVKDNIYEVYSKQGKYPTGYTPEDWSIKAEKYGAGEILINSIERDGWLRGYDLVLCEKVKKSVNVPVLFLGGCGNWNHMYEAFNKANADAVCTQNIYHFTEDSIKSAKAFLSDKNINIRI